MLVYIFEIDIFTNIKLKYIIFNNLLIFHNVIKFLFLKQFILKSLLFLVFIGSFSVCLNPYIKLSLRFLLKNNIKE